MPTLDEICKACCEGVAAMQNGLFPPHNPYAPQGLLPHEDNPLGTAWFHGYWAVSYKRHGFNSDDYKAKFNKHLGAL